MCPKGSGRPSSLSAPGLRSWSSQGSPQVKTSRGGRPSAPHPPCPTLCPQAPCTQGTGSWICRSLRKILGLCSQICLLEHVDSSHEPTRRLRSERGALKCQEPQPGAGYGRGDRERASSASPSALSPRWANTGDTNQGCRTTQQFGEVHGAGEAAQDAGRHHGPRGPPTIRFSPGLGLRTQSF